jgi:bacterial/archaeal transporter family protein
MTEGTLPAWLFWALLSASFAAATAILTKLGVEGVHPDVATLIRTVVVLLMLAILVGASGVGLSCPACRGGPGCFSPYRGLPPGRPGFATSGRCNMDRRPRSRRWTS